MMPSLGRIVQYTLSEYDAEQINRHREDAKQNSNVGNTGFILHVGNPVKAGDNYPLIITRVWGNAEFDAVNGQVLLDGNDTFWATSVVQGEGERTFREFPRV